MIENITLVNTVLNSSIDINVENGPYYTEQIDIGKVKGNHHTHTFPGQDGENVDSVNFLTRDISITGWAVRTSLHDIIFYKNILNYLVNPKQLLKLIYKDYSIEFYPDNSVQFSTKRKENNEVVCKFVITGTAYNPLWSSKSQKDTKVSYVQNNFILPVSIVPNEFTFGVLQPVSSASIVNKGLPVGCNILISASGTVKNPGIICSQTQEKFTINKTLTAGEKVIVNTEVGNRSIKGVLQNVEYNYMKYKKPGSDWLTLYNGQNDITYFADEGLEFLSIHIAYYESFLEVQE